MRAYKPWGNIRVLLLIFSDTNSDPTNNYVFINLFFFVCLFFFSFRGLSLDTVFLDVDASRISACSTVCACRKTDANSWESMIHVPNSKDGSKSINHCAAKRVTMLIKRNKRRNDCPLSLSWFSTRMFLTCVFVFRVFVCFLRTIVFTVLLSSCSILFIRCFSLYSLYITFSFVSSHIWYIRICVCMYVNILYVYIIVFVVCDLCVFVNVPFSLIVCLTPSPSWETDFFLSSLASSSFLQRVYICFFSALSRRRFHLAGV